MLQTIWIPVHRPYKLSHQNCDYRNDIIMADFRVPYLEDVNMEPLRLPNVEQATNIGITHDITPRVLFPKVCKSENINILSTVSSLALLQAM